MSNQTIPELVNATLQENHLTLKSMAAGLTIYLEPADTYSLTAIWTWKQGVYPPRYGYMQIIRNTAPADTWQYKFADAAMRILHPEKQIPNLEFSGVQK